MHSTVRILLVSIAAASTTLGQTSPSPALGAKASPSSPSVSSTSTSTSPATASSPAARTDMYHVHFAKSAVGKAAEHAEALKKQDPNAPMPGHFIVLRHQNGDAWDYCTIEHLGTKATVEVNRPATPATQLALGEWHTDTLASGPSWSEFTKQLGIDDASKSPSAAGYVVSMYRPEPGQRDALDKFLNEPSDPSTDTAAGRVVLQHLDGAA